MADEWDDPLPTADEMIERRSRMSLTALLSRFARECGGLSPREVHDKAANLADQISKGFDVLNEHARGRLRDADVALHDIRMLLPPAPIHHDDGKVAMFKPPEPEKMLYLVRQALDRHDEKRLVAHTAEQTYSPPTASGDSHSEGEGQ